MEIYFGLFILFALNGVCLCQCQIQCLPLLASVLSLPPGFPLLCRLSSQACLLVILFSAQTPNAGVP